MNKKTAYRKTVCCMICCMSGFILLSSLIIVPLYSANERSYHYDLQHQVASLNDDLLKRNVVAVQAEFTGELPSDEIPKNFFVTSYGFVAEARRILQFIDLLERHKDREVCMQTIEQINEVFGLQFYKTVMHHKGLDPQEKLRMLGVMEKLRSAVGLKNFEFARMVIGLFQVRVSNLDENKLGMMAIILERAREAFLSEVLSYEELGLFIGQLEEVFITKPRTLPWMKIGKTVLITAVLAGLGYAAYKLYSWSKNKMVPTLDKLGKNIKKSAQIVKEGGVEVVRDGIKGAIEDLKTTIPETIKKAAEEVKETLQNTVQEGTEKAPEAAANIFWQTAGAIVAAPVKGVKHYTYDKLFGSKDEPCTNGTKKDSEKDPDESYFDYWYGSGDEE